MTGAWRPHPTEISHTAQIHAELAGLTRLTLASGISLVRGRIRHLATLLAEVNEQESDRQNAVELHPELHPDNRVPLLDQIRPLLPQVGSMLQRWSMLPFLPSTAEQRTMAVDLAALTAAAGPVREVLAAGLGRKTVAVVPGTLHLHPVTLLTFGYTMAELVRRTVPGPVVGADLVADARGLAVPETLPHLTGRDPAVQRQVRQAPGAADLIARLLDCAYTHGRMRPCRLAIGSWAGRVRSVAVAEIVAAELAEAGYPVVLQHLDLHALPLVNEPRFRP